jgi:hypothetical protein
MMRSTLAILSMLALIGALGTGAMAMFSGAAQEAGIGVWAIVLAGVSLLLFVVGRAIRTA